MTDVASVDFLVGGEEASFFSILSGDGGFCGTAGLHITHSVIRDSVTVDVGLACGRYTA